MSHRHLSEDELERMCLGTIELDELARLTEHVLNCAECAERLGQTRDYIHAMQQALKALAPNQLDSRDTHLGDEPQARLGDPSHAYWC